MIYIIGAGGHTRTTISILQEKYDNSQLSIIDSPKFDGENILGINIMQIDYLESISGDYFVSIGDNEKRKEIFEKIENKLNIINVISKSAYIHKSCFIGIGNLISFKAVICPGVKIGNNNIINTGAIVEHESLIGSNCHIAPGAIILGRVKIGNNVLIGAGTIIKNGISVCDNVILGAGSVVISNINKPGKYVGKVIKK